VNGYIVYNDIKKGGQIMSVIIPFLPKIPTLPPKADPVSPPTFFKTDEKESETLFLWFKNSAKTGIKSLPKQAKKVGIRLLIVAVINLIFWTAEPYFMPSFLGNIVSLVVFLTATYNDIIPKTIFWVIIFTFGEKLFKRIRKEGIKKSLSPLKEVIPQFKEALTLSKRKGKILLLLGAGLGLVIANNFASYSRFSGARNKFDKYFVALVIGFSVSYLLGEGRKTGLFKFVRLLSSDLARWTKKNIRLVEYEIFVIMTAFVVGIFLDAPLIAVGWLYGGYIMGALCILAAIAYPFLDKKPNENKG
jgi:hypothetical protein